MQSGPGVTIGPFEPLNYETLKIVSNPTVLEILIVNSKIMFGNVPVEKIYSFLMTLINLGK